MADSSFSARIGGAPISWGVCEAPDWGYELPAERVLDEMRSLGLAATELGPTGYLGATPDDVKAQLAAHGLRLIGGFLPVTMHVDPDLDLSPARAAMEVLAAAGSDVVVLAAQSTDGSYDRKVRLTDDEWPTLLANLDRLRAAAAELGLAASLHPHVGTAVEDRPSVIRLLESSDVPICLDTGHLVIGGMEPDELLSLAAGRVAHVHLKDVRRPIAATVSGGNTSYIAAVRAGLYAPLGQGDLDIARIVDDLERVGYQGWYVLEQDTAMFTEPAANDGPIEDVRTSIAYLESTRAR